MGSVETKYDLTIVSMSTSTHNWLKLENYFFNGLLLWIYVDINHFAFRV
uniref:Uncharacterized protein n=1 Tax=viral metagenome TaxID=1070528 RepID=A0A6C0C6F8_9ZZZZ